jgi:hypothetical protein
MDNHGGIISTEEISLFVHLIYLFGIPTSSNLVAEQEELAKEMINFALRSISFQLRKIH